MLPPEPKVPPRTMTLLIVVVEGTVTILNSGWDTLTCPLDP